MQVLLKVWPNQSVSLVTASGYTLSTYDSLQEAEQVRQAWYDANNLGRPQMMPTEQATPPTYLI